jgi:pyrroloquinoline-quinone synthase
LNRYYYQTRIPIKDALIVSKSEDPAFRRMWLRRIQDHDGNRPGEGGLASWLRLAKGVGLDPDEVAGCAAVLPGVRDACDRYVQFVRERSLLEAAASSLTELFAPSLMTRRIEAWKRHYSWIAPDCLEYFETRVSRAAADAQQAMDYVVRHAISAELQQQCLDALITKTDILWKMLDCIYEAEVGSLPKPRLSAKARLRQDRRTGKCLLLFPESGLELNDSATAIARLCTGEYSTSQIVQRLLESYAEQSPAKIEQDVRVFLDLLARRGLLQTS